PACTAPEDQRLGDLRDRAADRRRGVGGGARAGVELEHLEPVAERGLDFQSRRAFGGLHWRNPIGYWGLLSVILLLAGGLLVRRQPPAKSTQPIQEFLSV